MKTLFFVFALFFIVRLTPAQVQKGTKADANKSNEKLLWYQGKKINDTTLVWGNGSITTFHRKQNKVQVKLDPKNDPFREIIKELDKTETLKKEFIEKTASAHNGVINYPFALAGANEFDKIFNSYSAVRSDTISVPTINQIATEGGKAETKDETNTNETSSGSSQLQQLYKDLANYVQKYKNNKTNVTIASPPSKEMGICWTCDKAKQNTYDKEVRDYVANFMKEEKKLRLEYLTVMRSEAESGKKTESELAQIDENLSEAAELIHFRLSYACEKLMKQYANDFSKLPVVMQIFLGQQREEALLGYETKLNQSLPSFKQILKSFSTQYKEAIQRKDYTVMFDFSTVISLIRQQNLLGAEEDDALMQVVDDMEKLNRFTLSISIHVDKSLDNKDLVGTDVRDWKQFIDLKGEKIVSLMPVENCRFTLVAATGARSVSSDAQTMFWKVENETFMYSTDNGLARAKLIGAENLETDLPSIGLNFCEKRGSMNMALFNGDPFPHWEFPGSEQLGGDLNWFISCFNSEKPGSTVIDLKKLEERNALLLRRGSDPSLKNLEDMKTSYEWVKKYNPVSDDQFLLSFEVKNGSGTIADGMMKAPRQDGQLKEGWIKIKIEHTPQK